ncbi:MAG: NRDE family protein [Bacteroidota bacterium]
MCLITFAYHIHPKYKFILSANRDEFYVRPTSTACWWKDHPEVLGGRDLEAMGTWMGVNKNGRFAAVTNYRDLKNIKPDAKSRGHLPTDFILGKDSPEAYALKVHREGDQYNGFNLLLMDEEIAYVSNYSEETYELGFGLYGISNALLDSPWPKVEKAKSSLEKLIQKDFQIEDLIEIMMDTETAPDHSLPETGLDYLREKALSSMYIQAPDYGTCCTTAILIDFDGNVEFVEKSFPVGNRKKQIVSFKFKIEK